MTVPTVICEPQAGGSLIHRVQALLAFHVIAADGPRWSIASAGPSIAAYDCFARRQLRLCDMPITGQHR